MNKTILIKSIAIIAVFCIAAFALLKNPAQQEGEVIQENTTGTIESQANTEITTTKATSSTYKNGSYVVTGNYVSPGGPESINVTVTLTADVITDASVVSNAILPISQKMQGAFIGGYKNLVIGKNIDEVELDKVAGSSLTPKGFNDALAKVKIEAQS